jgi:hypothetical protein
MWLGKSNAVFDARGRRAERSCSTFGRRTPKQRKHISACELRRSNEELCGLHSGLDALDWLSKLVLFRFMGGILVTWAKPRIKKEGVGSAAFLVRDAVLGEEDVSCECWYNPCTHPQKEWRNFFAIICGRLSGYHWMTRVVQAAAWMTALLTFIEPPHWCRHGDFAMLEDNKFGGCGVLLSDKGPSLEGEESADCYPSLKSMQISLEEAMAVEWLCLSVATFCLILKVGREGFKAKQFFITGYSHRTRTLQSFLITFLCYGPLTKCSKYDPFVRLLLLGSFCH